MKKTELPSISIIIATLNSSRTLELCMSKVKGQEYPSNKIEIIIADGGSKDNTLDIARKFKARIVNVDPNKQNAEYNKGIGLENARYDIALFLDHDNIMPHKKWLRRMVQPFLDNRDVVVVEPLRFYYDRKMTFLDRYFALFGGSDPVVYYLKKTSHLSWAYDKYNLLGEHIDFGKYYLVRFSKDNFPALGGNGAAFKRKTLIKHANTDPKYFIHPDIAADLIRNGYDTFAFTKDSIIHLTNNKLLPFLSRRKYFIEAYYFKKKEKRRFLAYDPKRDFWTLIWYIFLSLTVVVPLYDAAKGYRKIHDPAWFIHPFMCLAFLLSYGAAVLDQKRKNV